MEEIKYSCEVEIENVPVKWLPKIELFYPDLPGFPIIYVHTIIGEKRIYGFPVTITIKKYNEDNTCNIAFLFLSNLEISKIETYKQKVKSELENRIGLSDPVTRQDIINASPTKYHPFLLNLFDICTNLYGEKLPFGRFYEEVYSIIRFVAAFRPKTGRQSEMRMLYNFLRIFGTRVDIKINRWSFLEFYILPTYKDLKNNNFSEFSKFKTLYRAISKVWTLEFTEDVTVQNVKFKAIKKAWPQNKEKFIETKLIPWIEDNKITKKDSIQIEQLIDAFNRFSWRATFFIWTIFTINNFDYEHWDKNLFIDFYNTDIKGCSPKVVACFLQQGFANKDIIPIDTWIKTFYEYALAIKEPATLLSDFKDLGKLERLIWLTSQANKTNIREYMELLWCQRYGTNGNGEFRGENPLSCYECKLRENCIGFSNIENKKIFITDIENEQTITNKDGEILGHEYNIAKLKEFAPDIEFICYTRYNIPRKIYIKKDNGNYILIDEFSGALLNEKYKFNAKLNKIYTVKDFLLCLPSEFKIDEQDIIASNLAQDKL